MTTPGHSCEIIKLMTIHLKPEMEALVQKDVNRGPYQSVDDFVERAVELLH